MSKSIENSVELPDRAAGRSGVAGVASAAAGFSRRAWLPVLLEQGPLISLVLLCAVISVLTPSFLSVRNLLNVLDQITVLGIMALGMTAVIIIGGIDLSVGSVLALAMMVMGWLANTAGLPFAVAIPASILVAGLCGLVSGLLNVVMRLPAFIATLAMMSVARGLANIITNGEQIVGYPDWFTALSIDRHFGFLSATVGLFVALMMVGFVILKYRAAGRSLYAIGGSAEVARLAGIKVRATTLAVYTLCGALAGVAAVVLASRLDSSQPSAGTGYELDTIAAVVIGGASLAGGTGTVLGTAVGVLTIGVLRNGLNLIGVSPFVQQIVIGLVIVLAVGADTLRRRNAA
ncbi:ABC transporter permease [Paraburkholderia kururiensis]|uniref:ABC transporter permease n=1 Tax=Paraburkholderia kururiensis TaxID=984307 RepID=UPI000ABFA48E|nr:ABC transporter permease [Paraburkholderia kururiensis]